MSLARLALPTALLTAVGAPYLVSNSNVSKLFSPREAHQSDDKAAADFKATAAKLEKGPPGSSPIVLENGEVLHLMHPATVPTAELDGGPVADLGEVIRFDITSDWVLQRWARVSTGIVEFDQTGYRVPLVTGTQMHDLAGSLTYFFDAKNKVQRITFYGSTGDPQRLVELVTNKFGLQARTSKEPGERLYSYAKFGRTVSWLKYHPLPIQTTDLSHARFKVSLDMQRPPLM